MRNLFRFLEAFFTATALTVSTVANALQYGQDLAGNALEIASDKEEAPADVAAINRAKKGASGYNCISNRNRPTFAVLAEASPPGF
jgi:hypothetical protein